MQTIDWASLWGGISAFLTFGLLVATCIYAYLTWRMVRVAEAQVRESTRPRVLVYVAARESTFLTLCVENVGLGVANDVRLKLDRPVHPNYGDKENLQNVALFSNVLPSLAPRTFLRLGLGTTYLRDGVDRNLHPLEFTVKASYKFAGIEFQEVFEMNLKSQFGRVLLEHDYLSTFAKSFPEKFDRFSRELIDVVRNLKDR